MSTTDPIDASPIVWIPPFHVPCVNSHYKNATRHRALDATQQPANRLLSTLGHGRGYHTDFVPTAPSVIATRPAAQLVDSTYLKKYKTAIEKMRSLSSDDPRSFTAQANVHCAYCNGGYYQDGYADSKLLLDVHFSWLFFPFHRWYLYFFEKICQNMVDDDTFALPFWNWDNPPGMFLPAIFKDSSSPLYDSLRNPSHLNTVLDLSYEGTDSTDSPITVIRNNLYLMYKQMVTQSTTPLSFFGKAFRAGETSDPGEGSIETSPHTNVHRWTGDPNESHGEDMGSFYSAGRDPVFYSHPANVDRMCLIIGYNNVNTICLSRGNKSLVEGILAKKFLNHSASVPVSSRATNSDSIVDLAMIVCLADFHAIAPPPREWILFIDFRMGCNPSHFRCGTKTATLLTSQCGTKKAILLIFRCGTKNILKYYIFYNRMWSLWNSLGGQNFTDSDWLNSSFYFYNEQAKPVKVYVKDCLDTSVLGYTYQTVDIPWLNSKPSPRRTAIALPTAPTPSQVFPTTLEKAITVLVKRPKKKRTKKEKQRAEEVLEISGIQYNIGEFVKFDVYINEDTPDESGPEKTELVGSFINVPHGHSMISTTTKSFAISEVLQELGADEFESVLVTLVPKSSTVTISGVIESRSSMITARCCDFCVLPQPIRALNLPLFPFDMVRKAILSYRIMHEEYCDVST
ncbi:polyphenol oxidase I, chloroplastic-like [Coffea arabica]|uniref:Polyphenol oxidase I, chloroplastic-like n=1 Tax=Coffea arabica TaxID=13443 RepID=A0ABM4UF39_COFAR